MKWTLPPPAPAEFLRSISYPDIQNAPYAQLIAQLLWNREIQDSSAVDDFLSFDYERDTHDPFLLKGMDRAVARLADALRDQERIQVFSDYDADGVCGAAILSEFFSAVSANFDVSIPDRLKEHYGLSSDKVRDFAARGAKVLVTVDCGITNHDEIALAGSLGMDVIVVDHHLLHGGMPPAYAVVNHQQPNETYPERVLSGAGLAYKVVQAMVVGGRIISTAF
jgi:single-stranded-DNA-specific exonuclease